jgi:hypothetical protein
LHGNEKMNSRFSLARLAPSHDYLAARTHFYHLIFISLYCCYLSSFLTAVTLLSSLRIGERSLPCEILSLSLTALSSASTSGLIYAVDKSPLSLSHPPVKREFFHFAYFCIELSVSQTIVA